MRTRAVEQDDVHVFCRKDDVPDEVARFIGRLITVYSDLGSRSMRWLCPLVRSHGLAPTNAESGPRHCPATPSANAGRLFRSTQRGYLVPTQARIRLARPLWPLVVLRHGSNGLRAPRTAWAPPTSHHGVYQSYTYRPVNSAANHDWSR